MHSHEQKIVRERVISAKKSTEKVDKENYCVGEKKMPNQNKNVFQSTTENLDRI